MSPSEFDLRAALRDGEGDGPDVEHIVAAGRARRGQRRNRFLTAAAAAVVVAGVSTGGVLIGTRDNGPQSAADASVADAAGGRAAVPSAAATSTPAGKPAAAQPQQRRAAADKAVSCPASFPETLLPGGGSPGQFGSDGPLFARPVVAMVVCGYGAESSAAPGRLILTGADAVTLAESLEKASTQVVNRKCPPPQATSRLAMIGVGTDGAAMRAVTTTLIEPACDGQVTNGTAIRYGWQPPSGLENRLIGLVPASLPLPSIRPSGKQIGSPIRN